MAQIFVEKFHEKIVTLSSSYKISAHDKVSPISLPPSCSQNFFHIVSLIGSFLEAIAVPLELPSSFNFQLTNLAIQLDEVSSLHRFISFPSAYSVLNNAWETL